MDSSDQWRPRYIVFFEAYYHELISGELINLWGASDFAISIIVTITSSGSAISGWALWNDPHWKALWSILAGIASLGAVIRTVARSSSRLERLAERKREFSLLRWKLQFILYKMTQASDAPALEKEFQGLLTSFTEAISRYETDLLETKALRNRAQTEVNRLLKGYGITETGVE
jgi:hypothetical protein